MNKGFVRTVVLIVIALFLLSYFNIYKIEEHVSPGQVRGVFESFINWFKGLFN